MIEFSKWIRKTHPNYFTESEDLNANPLANPPDEAVAANVDRLLAAPTPDDFKNEFDLNHSFDELSDEPIEPNGDLKKNFKDFDFNLNWNEIESLMEDYTVNPDSSSKK